MTAFSKVLALLVCVSGFHVASAGPQAGGQSNMISCSVPLLQWLGGTRNCCPATGHCQDSSCRVFGYANSARSNCPGANRDCPELFCQYVVDTCNPSGQGAGALHCYGTVQCKTPGCQSNQVGKICLEDGNSDNFKICGGDGIDCEVTAWTPWSTCPVTCGYSTVTRSRSVSTQPTGDGTPCPSNLQETKECNAGPCPTGCLMNDWSGWGECSKTCGVGSRSQTRTIARDGPNCPPTEVSEPCNTNDCTPFEPEGDPCMCDDAYRTQECLAQENQYVGYWQVNFPNCDVNELLAGVSDYGCQIAKNLDSNCDAPTIYCTEHIPDEVIAKLPGGCAKFIKPEVPMP